MTITSNTVHIAAAPATIYELASRTERWPQILPHYRWVKILKEEGATRTVEMAARRDWIPLRWVALQTNDPRRPHIAFHHLQGWTRGMDVEWRFEPEGNGTRVTIEHRLTFRFPLAAGWLGRHIVSDFFIHAVAARTLYRIKDLAEARA
jgi:ribosome-associated toxin RatA of RatAB toxin-antitoxin module